jgi:uncharacterized protein (TIGR00369 family)
MPLPFHTHIPFVETLGIELMRMEPGEAELQLLLRPELTNSWEVAHGGLVMTLLDVALAHGARSPLQAGGDMQPGVVTVEMKTSFLRPGLGLLRAIGRRLHRTASLAFCEGSVLDAQGQLLAHATGTFKYMRALPAGGRKIHRPAASD